MASVENAPWDSKLQLRTLRVMSRILCPVIYSRWLGSAAGDFYPLIVSTYQQTPAYFRSTHVLTSTGRTTLSFYACLTNIYPGWSRQALGLVHTYKSGYDVPQVWTQIKAVKLSKNKVIAHTNAEIVLYWLISTSVSSTAVLRTSDFCGLFWLYFDSFDSLIL